MGIIQAIVYGIVQGLTEFLPVSSNAHLRIVPALLGWEDPGAAFTAVIQLGTVLAVIIYFASDLKKAFLGWFNAVTGKGDKNSHDAKVGWAVFYGTLPIIVFGLALKKHVEGDFRSLYVIAGSMIVMGIGMQLAEHFGKRNRDLESITPLDGVKVGFWQCLALFPGMSRSGSTISGALVGGFDRASAARFSFLMSVPSVTAAGLLEAYKERHSFEGALLVPTVVATVISFFVGYAAISGFIKYLGKKGIAPFVLYRIVLGLFLIGMLQAGKLDPMAGIEKEKAPAVATPAP